MLASQALTNQQRGQAPKQSTWQKFVQIMDTPQRNLDVTISGSLGAHARDALNDIRGTLIQAYTGMPEHVAAPGPPMATPQMTTAAMTGKKLDLSR
ncbi:hypothetical protein BH10PLA2_BH10PLA2_12830 [soil metagenome]